MEDNIELFWEIIINWFEQNERKYSWRLNQKPYNVLIAEFLLQKTNARKVEDIYIEITNKYSTVHALAKADIEELSRIIRPLGLLYRSERMIDCANKIVNDHQGEVPNTELQLNKLPGVGDYISKAVLCYAYGKKTVPIDTNVIRLFHRCFNLKSNKKRPRTDLSLAKEIKKQFIYKDFRKSNLAVLDFSGLLCTASKPKCEECPLKCICFTIKQKNSQQY